MKLYRICLKMATDEALSVRLYVSVSVKYFFEHLQKYLKKRIFFWSKGQNVLDVRIVFRTDGCSKPTFSFRCTCTLPPLHMSMSQNFLKWAEYFFPVVFSRVLSFIGIDLMCIKMFIHSFVCGYWSIVLFDRIRLHHIGFSWE